MHIGADFSSIKFVRQEAGSRNIDGYISKKVARYQGHTDRIGNNTYRPAWFRNSYNRNKKVFSFGEYASNDDIRYAVPIAFSASEDKQKVHCFSYICFLKKLEVRSQNINFKIPTSNFPILHSKLGIIFMPTRVGGFSEPFLYL